MSRSPAHRLTAATPAGTPALSVIEYSTGGLLVEADVPFEIGAVVHLRLTTVDGRLDGMFALRCLHAHTVITGDHAAYLSALAFVHPLDTDTRDALLPAGSAPRGPQRSLRLVSTLTD